MILTDFELVISHEICKIFSVAVAMTLYFCYLNKEIRHKIDDESAVKWNIQFFLLCCITTDTTGWSVKIPE